MNILIVDDNSANRMTIKWVLTKFDDMNISEADSGQNAINASMVNSFDLIFMDVMMPGMTGIEATKEIKKIDKKVMIVAVTALDDDETCKEMFTAGAEDYITKPIKQDIFKSRLQSYFKIIESRNFYSPNIDTLNLFREPIRNHYTIFKVKDEAVLAEFWEHYLFGGPEFGNTQLCDAIAKIYYIGTVLLKMSIKFFIFCEESDGLYYFTLNNTKFINKSALEDVIRKDNFKGKYLISSDRVSFAVEKGKGQEAPAVNEVEKTIAPQIQMSVAEAQTPVEVISEQITHNEEVLQVFNFLEEGDHIDLEEYIKDLDSVLMLFQHSTLDANDVYGVSHQIDKIASILSTYADTYDLSVTLRSLSLDISENVDAFISNSGRLASLFFSFTKDLLEWHHKIFKEGAPSIQFMDATIMANSMMISSSFKPNTEAASESLDDIFF
jgi:CheY-like chemotaxis protein